MLLLNQSYQFPLPRVKNQTYLSNTIFIPHKFLLYKNEKRKRKLEQLFNNEIYPLLKIKKRYSSNFRFNALTNSRSQNFLIIENI